MTILDISKLPSGVSHCLVGIIQKQYYKTKCNNHKRKSPGRQSECNVPSSAPEKKSPELKYYSSNPPAVLPLPESSSLRPGAKRLSTLAQQSDFRLGRRRCSPEPGRESFRCPGRARGPRSPARQSRCCGGRAAGRSRRRAC